MWCVVVVVLFTFTTTSLPVLGHVAVMKFSAIEECWHGVKGHGHGSRDLDGSRVWLSHSLISIIIISDLTCIITLIFLIYFFILFI